MRCAELTAQPAGKGVGRHFRHCWEGQSLASRSSALRGSQLAVPTPCRKTVRPKVAQPTQAVAQVDAKTQAHAQKITVSTNGSEFGATEMSRTVLGIILGGGAGSRLYPLTKKRAKPAVPLGANYRLIDIPVSNCINSGVNKIYCLTQFNSASLNRHLSSAYNSNVGGYNSRGFVEVLAASQTTTTKEWFQGTADAVRQYMWLFDEACRDGVEDFLILSGAAAAALPRRQQHDFGSDIIPGAKELGCKVQAHLFKGYWEDIGTVRAFYESNLALTDSPNPNFRCGGGRGGVGWVGGDVERSILGDGCIVEPDAKIHHSVIGLRSIIREGCVIEDSLLMGADYYEQYEECEAFADCLPLGVGKGTHIKGAIVDKNARIGKFCKIVNAEGIQESFKTEEQGWVIRDGVVVVIKDSNIPDGTII
ncbi:hypothetical protein CHLNCDRAFT_56519 [Chlorella variabilis]|uniref:glucose-1-phosphate adenylyltransferase n=1 Tax=Chlorella variabilis TaxID=554065 RepID=E1Z2N8_CHLVA|nr:hypothetical protein CHLNCDRAFT_56519 [Chlorella variabilis]EFN59695.1 hypothetical protein CHLNCDRAFT_56519 [Chlorella variabilis]|eukprot:XP_005851797.1 hypothetical protein CHLNCDRAFT_56519 [Chlorella variabilis]